MPLLVKLFLSFFKIGLFGFGGGYAMVSLIQDELLTQGWLSLQTFIDVIAIAEMTPGPIAINSGTFVGYKISLFWGSVSATMGVVAPSFILVLSLAHFFKKVKESPYVTSILKFLRPVVIGLILAASVSFGESSLVDWKSFIIAALVFLAMVKSNISPILLIVIAGGLGILLY